MKRILLATVGVAVVAVFTATIGFAQPTASTAVTAAPAAKQATVLWQIVWGGDH